MKIKTKNIVIIVYYEITFLIITTKHPFNFKANELLLLYIENVEGYIKISFECKELGIRMQIGENKTDEQNI